ncbi:hypothetical protein EAH88_18440 [Rhodanobacter glycinis]|uniref:Uncharacterized protein n=2 Tax=Rhodanobacter glycinis TaxID=582702 RepID=A0A502BUD1_9GAMM|nr:hypothetical protein EAH88_18440 [Rhodanobacter glycinis]
MIPAYVVGRETQPEDGWLPCANRLHLVGPIGKMVHFIENAGEAAEVPGLWVAHDFGVSTKSQLIWIWNANPDEMGGSGDIRWSYKLATGYYMKPVHGSADSVIKKCKHSTTYVALGGEPLGQPGETVGPKGDDDSPVVH